MLDCLDKAAVADCLAAVYSVAQVAAVVDAAAVYSAVAEAAVADVVEASSVAAVEFLVVADCWVAVADQQLHLAVAQLQLQSLTLAAVQLAAVDAEFFPACSAAEDAAAVAVAAVCFLD